MEQNNEDNYYGSREYDNYNELEDRNDDELDYEDTAMGNYDDVQRDNALKALNR